MSRGCRRIPIEAQRWQACRKACWTCQGQLGGTSGTSTLVCARAMSPAERPRPHFQSQAIRPNDFCPERVRGCKGKLVPWSGQDEPTPEGYRVSCGGLSVRLVGCIHAPAQPQATEPACWPPALAGLMLCLGTFRGTQECRSRMFSMTFNVHHNESGARRRFALLFCPLSSSVSSSSLSSTRSEGKALASKV
eukprot:g9053.t1